MHPAPMSSHGSTLGDLLRAALRLYRRGIVPFLALSSLSWLGSSVFPGTTGPVDELFRLLPWWLQTVAALAALVLSILPILAVTYVTADLYHGQVPRLLDSLGRTLGRAWAMFRLALLAYVALLVPVSPFLFVLFAHPALQSGPFGLSTTLLAVCVPVILLLPMTLAVPAVQLEPSLGAVGAVKRAWALVHGAWWYLTGVLLLAPTLLWLGWKTTSLLDPLNAPLLSGLLNAILVIACSPLIGIVATLLYYQRCDHLASQPPAPTLTPQRRFRSKSIRRRGGSASPPRGRQHR
jgi:hypothetical protein